MNIIQQMIAKNSPEQMGAQDDYYEDGDDMLAELPVLASVSSLANNMASDALAHNKERLAEISDFFALGGDDEFEKHAQQTPTSEPAYAGPLILERQVNDAGDSVVASSSSVAVPKAAEISQNGSPISKLALADSEPKSEVLPAAPAIVSIPEPELQRPMRRAGRVKTRLLGFEHSDGTTEDHFDDPQKAAATTQPKFPVGWIVVVKGPGRGKSFALSNGMSQIGRGEDQAIKLDFGDNSISRSNHAAIAFDPEVQQFFLGHGGKSNLVRLNGKPVLSTENIKNSDLILIGETTLRFIALCDEDFTWNEQYSEGETDVATARTSL